MATVPNNLIPYRLVAPLLGLAVLLVPWTFVLAYRLPARHTTQHWDLAWVGFDIALAAAIGATGLGIARCGPWAPSAAYVAATLLVCDAWFDNVLANGRSEQVEAGLEAALVELPLALLCVWLAHNRHQTVNAVLTTLGRRDR